MKTYPLKSKQGSIKYTIVSDKYHNNLICAFLQYKTCFSFYPLVSSSHLILMSFHCVRSSVQWASSCTSAGCPGQAQWSLIPPAPLSPCGLKKSPCMSGGGPPQYLSEYAGPSIAFYTVQWIVTDWHWFILLVMMWCRSLSDKMSAMLSQELIKAIVILF